MVAREEERRRLRADLHDDLGPQLAAVAIQLDAATLRARRTGADDGAFVGLRAATDDAITTLRRAVEALRPPALDELGLAGGCPRLRRPARDRGRAAPGRRRPRATVPGCPPRPRSPPTGSRWREFSTRSGTPEPDR